VIATQLFTLGSNQWRSQKKFIAFDEYKYHVDVEAADDEMALQVLLGWHYLGPLWNTAYGAGTTYLARC
jgi:hypothetical protein